MRVLFPLTHMVSNQCLVEHVIDDLGLSFGFVYYDAYVDRAQFWKLLLDFNK